VGNDDLTIQRLIRHRRRAEERAATNGIKLGDRAFVFSADRDGSTPWLPNRGHETFLAHLRRAGVARFRLHDLRHFMATQTLAHGVAVVTVSQRLGHARASTTLNVYGHCIPGADRDAALFHLQPHHGPLNQPRGQRSAVAAVSIDDRHFQVLQRPTGAPPRPSTSTPGPIWPPSSDSP
jgi:hypothetical protein